MNDIATWLNTLVGVIGIIVGIIGWKSLSAAVKIRNNLNASGGSTIQQAQVISNGLDTYAVIRLSRDTTKEELQKIVDEIANSEIILDCGNASDIVDKDE